MKPKHCAALVVVGLLTVVLGSGVNLTDAIVISDNLNTGPYVDIIPYRVIYGGDQRILALLQGGIEMDTSFFDPANYPILDADPDIDIFSALRNGYGQITINCRDYPLNISGFRQAFAYAYDKSDVQANIMLGFSQLQDSLVPYANSFCIEDELEYHYYDPDPITGNQILDDLGFVVQGDGWRTAPDGSPIDIEIIYGAHTPDVGGGCAQLGVDALVSLHIHAHTLPQDFSTYTSNLANHGAYDMIVYETNFYDHDIDWLAYDYWSDNADVTDQNPSNFVNTTYDSHRGQLLNAATYPEVYEAASQMQQILHYNVPRLVLYENIHMQGYRNDVFTGHVEDLSQYISGQWTTRKIHRIDDRLGGTVQIGLAQQPDSFNFFTTNSPFSANILSNLHASLYKYGPDLVPQRDLAEALLTETHADNAAVPEGHTKYTIDLIQNATWSDGVPVTAADVAFTFVYALESQIYGNPAGLALSNLVSVTAPTPNRVLLMFDSESYWHFSNFAFEYIIPQHIFNDVDGIGYAGWDTWNPVFDPAEPNVCCGPFIVTDFVAGEFYEISANPYYHWRYVEAPNPQPQIQSMGYVEYVEGTEGNEIVWVVSDDNPLFYMVYKDNSPIVSSAWGGEDIRIDIDGLLEGYYNYTLMLTDNSQNIVSDTVWVNVTASTSSTLTDTTTTGVSTGPNPGIGDGLLDYVILGVSLGSSVIILVVVVLIYKTKRA